MASTYPHTAYFVAAYAITALIYLGYAYTLVQRSLAMKRRILKQHLVASVEVRLQDYKTGLDNQAR